MRKGTAMRRIGLAATAACVGALGASGATTRPAAPKRVLFLGNSYTFFNDLPAVLRRMAASGKPPLKIHVDSYTKGGYSLERHWADGGGVKKIRRGGWDVVVLQDHSMGPVLQPAKMAEFARKIHAEVRKVGGRTVLFMTWARRHKPEMIEPLSRRYRAVAKELGAGVAPVGRAWQTALRERPKLALHRRDRSHPNERGTYLAACVFYAVLTGRDPRGRSTGGLLSLRAGEAKFLQDVAWRTVRAAKAAPATKPAPKGEKEQ